jgi:hypothetical protein
MCRRAMIAGVLLFAFTGWAAARPSAPKDVRPKTLPKLTLDCIFMRTIDNWRVLDPYHVVIYAPDGLNAYLVELADYCQPLATYPNRIRISSHEDGLLCAQDDDALFVGGQRCPIAAIFPYKTRDQPTAAR